MTIGELFRVLYEKQIVYIYQHGMSIYKGPANNIPIGLLDVTIKQISTPYNSRRILVELND